MSTDDRPQNLPQVNPGGLPSDDGSDDKIADQEQDAMVNNPQSQSSNPLITNIPVPDEAADSDLIEKEWVERAKQIVEHTKDDPYEQQRAISQMKADYLKKRYNKDINSVAE